ncbi:PREDICTED: serine/threonine-protein phosphatase 2A 55 kDa regulatory subunit B gamma isoform-like, partial [Chlamydotis macqueenii]|uniref:serine/threonine-protein phosphatase 2A 55 kDa regulatory subunit B gamma isoform-like n=1 Tax=Chlamydotis macqueenii TaxID=187382 RepID=UPI0005296CF0
MPAPNDGLVPGGFTLWCDGGKWGLLYGIRREKDLDEQEAKAPKKMKLCDQRSPGFSLLQIAVAYLLINMNADIEEHLELLMQVQEEASAVYHLLAAEWVDSASLWSLSKSLEEDLTLYFVLKTTWKGRASMRLILEMDLELLILQVSFGKLANIIAVVYHFHSGVNNFSEKDGGVSACQAQLGHPQQLRCLPGAVSPCVAADIISTVEFNHTGELLATGDKGGRVVIFQREPESKNEPYNQGEYNVYSTFQSHEPEFDYLKSLEIEEKINKIKWLPQQNAAHSLLSTNDKTIKLWKITERDKRPEGYNLKDEEGKLKDLSTVTSLQVPVLKPMDLMVEVTPRRIFANGHTYHVNSISVNSDCETYMSADDLRINLWHLAITDRSFNIVDIKPANMEDLTEVITASEFHPHHCNLFVYSSSKGSLRLCDMRASALCDKHSK